MIKHVLLDLTKLMNFAGFALVTANSEMNNSHCNLLQSRKTGTRALYVKEMVIPDADHTDCLSIGVGDGG